MRQARQARPRGKAAAQSDDQCSDKLCGSLAVESDAPSAKGRATNAASIAVASEASVARATNAAATRNTASKHMYTTTRV